MKIKFTVSEQQQKQIQIKEKLAAKWKKANSPQN